MPAPRPIRHRAPLRAPFDLLIFDAADAADIAGRELTDGERHALKRHLDSPRVRAGLLDVLGEELTDALGQLEDGVLPGPERHDNDPRV